MRRDDHQRCAGGRRPCANNHSSSARQCVFLPPHSNRCHLRSPNSGHRPTPVSCGAKTPCVPPNAPRDQRVRRARRRSGRALSGTLFLSHLSSTRSSPRAPQCQGDVTPNFDCRRPTSNRPHASPHLRRRRQTCSTFIRCATRSKSKMLGEWGVQL